MPNSPSEPRWLPVDEVVATNAELVDETGEPHLIRDLGLLESACAVAHNQWSYGGQLDIAVLAAALLFAIARNHPFMQGNKRTGFMAALQFLRINGWTVSSAIDSEHLGDLVVAVLAGESDESTIAEVFRAASAAPAP